MNKLFSPVYNVINIIKSRLGETFKSSEIPTGNDMDKDDKIFSLLNSLVDDIELIKKQINSNSFRTYKEDEIENDIEHEFKDFVEIFDLEQNGWDYCRRLLIEGELYFEHIIDKNNTNLGILGIVPIPAELIDPIYDNIQNYMIKSYLLRKPLIDKKNPTKIEKFENIPLEKNQVTYINSGIWNEDKTYRIPYIENARRAYRQLSLIEDSIVIYRLVRAPERLIFNIDVGNLSNAQAEQYLRKLMNSYWNSKTFDLTNGGVSNKFNPQSMLDAFWFPKRKNSEGSSVSSLAGGAQLDKLADLYYFVDALYKSLNVPVNRNKPDDKTTNNAQDILRDELKFARVIIRLQKLLSIGIKESFITHLKLKHISDEKLNIWEQYKLNERDIKIKLNPPSNYYQLRETQKLELSLGIFDRAKSTQFISPSLAAKDYLNWDDIKLKANQEWKRKDSAFEWELGQISQNGPAWKEIINNQNNQLSQPTSNTDNNEPIINSGGIGNISSEMPSPSDNNGGTGGADDVQEIPEFGDSTEI